MDLILNEYTGLYSSQDGIFVFDPSSGLVYQLTAYGYQPIGQASFDNGYPSQIPTQPGTWGYPGLPSPGAFPPWSGWGLPSPPQQRPPAPAGPTAPRTAVYAPPPPVGSVFSPVTRAPSAPGATVPVNVAPYATPAPAAVQPKPGTPTSVQGAPPPRQGAPPPRIVGQPASTTGGTITATPDASAGYWEIVPQTDGQWAGSAHENLFERTNLPIKKVRYPGGAYWNNKGITVMRLKQTTPGYDPDYFILYDNPSPDVFKTYWENVQAVQVVRVSPF